MKFQCGGCDTYYAISNVQDIYKKLEFTCGKCGNGFFIQPNLIFSSVNKKSKLVCENCGKLIEETIEKCD